MDSTVYLVITDFTYDGDNNVNLIAFDSLEKALNEFNAQIKDFNENDHLANNDSTVFEYSDNFNDDVMEEKYFIAYLDGEYCEDHIKIAIEKHFVY